MNSVLEEILRTGRCTSPSGETLEVNAQISREEGEFLQQIILDIKPKVSLEVGLSYGVSALYICEALAQVQGERHIVIDPWHAPGLHNLARAGYEQLIEFHNLPSYRALPQLEAEGRKIDFAFIDGWHTFDYVLVDFFYIDKMLRVGGIVAFDDTDFFSVRKLCRYIVTNLPYSVYKKGAQVSRGFSLRRRLLFKTPIISKNLKRITKPEILDPDEQLGLPDGSCIAFRKDREDVPGDGSDGTRRWDHHREF